MSDPEIIVAAATPDDSAARKGLKDQGFPEGMIDNMIESKKKFPLRIWVVDNSGSMRVNDGQRIVENSAADDLKFAQCTRWAELEQCVDYHIDLAGALEASSIFRLLNSPEQNNPPQFSIANNEHESIEEDIVHAKEVMKSSKPDEYTPLVRHVIEICEYVKTMEADLRRAGQKVAVILATDGVPSDGHKDKFLHHLKQLTALPVWLVIRLVSYCGCKTIVNSTILTDVWYDSYSAPMRIMLSIISAILTSIWRDPLKSLMISETRLVKFTSIILG